LINSSGVGDVLPTRLVKPKIAFLELYSFYEKSKDAKNFDIDNYYSFTEVIEIRLGDAQKIDYYLNLRRGGELKEEVIGYIGFNAGNPTLLSNFRNLRYLLREILISKDDLPIMEKLFKHKTYVRGSFNDVAERYYHSSIGKSTSLNRLKEVVVS